MKYDLPDKIYEGFVYFVTNASNKLVKIGCSSVDPEKRRFKHLQYISPVALFLDISIKVVGPKGAHMELERDLHDRHEHSHIHGEWYNINILAYKNNASKLLTKKLSSYGKANERNFKLAYKVMEVVVYTGQEKTIFKAEN